MKERDEIMEDIDWEDKERYDFGEDASEEEWEELHEKIKAERKAEFEMQSNEIEKAKKEYTFTQLEK